mmetsp:Transcript_92768/g.170213  ORF Transcript_92768/g.170213 Transcript_92768/m.170213 type:complete len:202 (-) Transcript_92768:82-687(-)
MIPVLLLRAVSVQGFTSVVEANGRGSLERSRGPRPHRSPENPVGRLLWRLLGLQWCAWASPWFAARQLAESRDLSWVVVFHLRTRISRLCSLATQTCRRAAVTRSTWTSPASARPSSSCSRSRRGVPKRSVQGEALCTLSPQRNPLMIQTRPGFGRHSERSTRSQADTFAFCRGLFELQPPKAEGAGGCFVVPISWSALHE